MFQPRLIPSVTTDAKGLISFDLNDSCSFFTAAMRWESLRAVSDANKPIHGYRLPQLGVYHFAQRDFCELGSFIGQERQGVNGPV
jgi:hypothetical protein